MILLYIILAFIMTEILNLKNLLRFNLFLAIVFNTFVILTICLPEMNVFVIFEKNIYLLYYIVPVSILQLINGAMAFKSIKNDIFNVRVLYFTMVIVLINEDLLTTLFLVFWILYELYKRSQAKSYIIKSKLTYVVPVLILVPFVKHSPILSSLYPYTLLALIVLLLVIEFGKMNLYRVLGVFIYSALIFNLSLNIFIPIILGSVLLVIYFLQLLTEIKVIKRYSIPSSVLDKIYTKFYVLKQFSERPYLLEKDGKQKQQKPRQLNQNTKHKNDLIFNFSLTLVVISTLGLYIVFRI